MGRIPNKKRRGGAKQQEDTNILENIVCVFVCQGKIQQESIEESQKSRGWGEVAEGVNAGDERLS